MNRLEERRRELKISQATLAARSGLSLPTVFRLLSGKLDVVHSRLENVMALAGALEMCFAFDPDTRELRFTVKRTAETVLNREARRKAARIVSVVQATSALEEQGVDEPTQRRMERQTMHELLAGSPRRIWSR
jgi:transcriptional regulator with XRE-family HTH domain